MKLLSIVVLALGIGFTPPSNGQETAGSKSKLSEDDAALLTELAQSDLAEIATAKLALQRAASSEVKQFAQHMVDEHGKMLAEGGKLAQSRGIAPPTQPGAKHRAVQDKLARLKGDAFDRAYAAQMVSDHQEALSLARKAAKGAKDPQLRAHASKAVPAIEKHLEMSKRLASGNKP